MPIQNLRNKLPVIGQIRKGDKDERGYPVELDHFRVVFNPAEQEAQQIFRDTYGEQPKQIRVMFPTSNVDQVWDAWLMAFQGKTLVAKADGERYWYKVDTQTGERIVTNGQPFTPYTPGTVEYSYVNKKREQVEVRCSPRARLYVIVQELFNQGHMGCLVFHTGSWNDVANMDNQIAMMMALSRGEIAYTPMVLTMYPETIQRTMPDGRKADKLAHLVKIDIDPAYARSALAKRTTPAELPAGDDWDPDNDVTDGEYQDDDVPF